MQTRIPFLLLTVMMSQATAGVYVFDTFDSLAGDDFLGIRDINSLVIDDPFAQGGSFGVDSDFGSGGDLGAAVFSSGFGTSQRGGLGWGTTLDFLYLDFDALGITGFEIDFAGADQSFEMSVWISGYTTNDGVVTLATADLEVSAGGPSTISLDRSNFEINSPEFLWSNVYTVTMIFNRTGSTQALDFAMTEFRGVPAPGALALFGLVGMSVSGRRRRPM